MKFLFPISTSKPLAPINDQNLKKGRPVFLLKVISEIRFSDTPCNRGNLKSIEVTFSFSFFLFF